MIIKTDFCQVLISRLILFCGVVQRSVFNKQKIERLTIWGIKLQSQTCGNIGNIVGVERKAQSFAGLETR